MSLRIYTSNRMEELIRIFAGLLGQQPLESPFEPEVILVQSRGMQRWISMQLALRLGVWANGHFPFPEKFVAGVFEKYGLEKADSGAFSKETMRWRIMRLLRGLDASNSFIQLRSYLTDDPEGLKLFQLAGKIADTFDQYTLFRADLLKAWEAGGNDEADDWQPELWRAVVEEATGTHRGKLKQMLLEKTVRSQNPAGDFNTRVSLFGISYLPPFHLEILSALSRSSEVNIFLLSPTSEYWGDIASRRKLASLPDAERALYTEGNPLLASLGRNGRDFSELILGLPEEPESGDDFYIDPGDATHLHALQSDMLNLTGAGEDGVFRTFDPEDRSIQIHSCHSPLREVEVLYDHLLDLFDQCTGLTPRDIVVMTPEIETYAPYITTVFGSSASSGAVLPYTITDRKLLNEGEISSALVKLLALYGSRVTAPALYDLLSTPPVSRRFGFSDEELDTVRDWIEKTRIRWGVDERSRQAEGVPAYRENSWRAGLDRLLLGYAMPDEGLLFDGALPVNGVEGDAAETLGKLADFIDAIDAFLLTMDRSRELVLWREFLTDVLNRFFAHDERSERELTKVHETIDKLTDIAVNARYETDVSPQVMVSWLKSSLEQASQGLGFMTGGITFCEMLPMRSIPFRVVAMIGMNDGVFPRQQHQPGFDLMARSPRPGDRSVRADDRYLFLESILSAREVLYISYVGQSIRDGSEIPPSVLVSELTDAVLRVFRMADGSEVLNHLLQRHRLQGFHQAYFTRKADKSHLFSYSRENFRALTSRREQHSVSRPFLDPPLTPPSDEMKSVTVEALCRFFTNPSAFFLEERLGMKPGKATLPLEDREVFDVSGLDAYLMRQELLEKILDGGNPGDLLDHFRSRGILPPARHGQQVFDLLLEETHTFSKEVLSHASARCQEEPLRFDLVIGGYHLTGSLDCLTDYGQLFYRCATMREAERIRTWIAHLAMNAVRSGEGPRESVLIMRNRSVRYDPVDDALSHLATLLDHYWAGLSSPLPFFPRSSTAWASKYGQSDDRRLDAAVRAWVTSYEEYPGEDADASFRLCFGTEPPFGADFGRISDTIICPMIGKEGKA